MLFCNLDDAQRGIEVSDPDRESHVGREEMSEDKPVTIVDLSKLAGRLAEAECQKAGVPFITPVQVALGSGLDVALTLMEMSVGVFQGLNHQCATESIAYFRAEANRSRSIDPQIAIWYDAWARAIETHFV